MKAPFPMAEKTAATTESSTRTFAPGPDLETETITVPIHYEPAE